MLKIENLSVKFDKKTIFENASFCANDTTLTVIKGRSGSGKSTFLKSLLFEHSCKYYYNDLDVMALNEEQRAKFYYDKVSFVYQMPLFINEMTIKEHINLIKNVYLINDNNELVERLDVNDLLDKYPKELSGGEKTRTAVLLALLKNPEIIVLDEPTASLDKNNAIKMIDLLKAYAKDGNIVIVASHDKRMIEAADCLYEIKNHKCVRVVDNSANSVVDLYNLKKRQYRYLKIKFGHKFYRLMMLILLSVSLVVSIFGINVYDRYTSMYEDKLAGMSSLELLVYKQKYNNDYFTYDGSEYPFTISEVEKIKNISNITDVTWHFDMAFEDEIGEVTNDSIGIQADEVMSKMSLFKDTDIIFQDKEICPFDLHGYDDSKDYRDKLAYVFSKQGIIISYSLFQAIQSQSNLEIKMMKNLSLEFIAFIPKYDYSNTSRMYLDDQMTYGVDVNTVRGVYRHITVPIKGVLKENQSLYGIEVNESSIFIENSVLQKYIDETYPDSTEISYAVAQDDDTVALYINDLPADIKNENVIHVITKTPWKPNSYIVTVDQINNIDLVVDKLIKMGFGVEADYVDTGAFNLLSKDNQRIMKVFISAIFIVLFSFYSYLKYLIIKENYETKSFLKNLGLYNREICWTFYSTYLTNALKMFTISSTILFCSNELFAKFQIIPLIIRPEISYFIYLLIMSVVIEFGIPIGLDFIIKGLDGKLTERISKR